MPLLERDGLAGRLRAVRDEALAGHGAMVLVSGEAGSGKTSLVREALDDAVTGYCDPLSTPRPLGPFLDVAARLWPGRARWTAFSLADRLLRWMSEPQPPVVIEDAHWLDTSSADALRYVGRRIAGTRGTLVVTARDDEASPLRAVLGELATVRVELAPLGPESIRVLTAGTGLDPDTVLELTGGNPFLVTEMVAATDGELSAPLRDSVLARLARLSPGARALIERLSVVPGRIGTDVADRDWEHLDELARAGLVRVAGRDVEFRHELVRLAVEHDLAPGRRVALHDEVLRRLLADERAEPARVAHHARRAHRDDVALTAEAEAAARASALGSHREAAQHARRAADDAARIATPDEHVRRLLVLAHAERAVAHDDAARAAAGKALAVAELLDDRELRSAASLVASRTAAAGDEAERLAVDAVALSEATGASSALADALANLANVRMLARDLDSASELATTAIAMAVAVGDPWPEAVASNALGSAMLLRGDPAGRDPLRRCLHVAAAHGFDTEVGRGYTNLVSAAGEARLYDLSAAAHAEALSYFVARDLDSAAAYTRAWNARCLVERGRWQEADEELADLRAMREPPTAHTRLLVHVLDARLAARRGAGDPDAPLALAGRIAAESGSLQRVAPVVAARAEADWLAGGAADLPALREAYALAIELANPWTIGELGFWLWRAAELASLPDTAAEPYRLHVAGEHHSAASAWEALGCPYEAAEAWADADDEAALRRALAAFTSLGANPARQRVARLLRERGVLSIPRGPRTSTAANAHGLTARESEVLGLVAFGRTDAEIAAALHLSVRTVEHHVAAILRKTAVASRRDLRGVAAPS